MVCSRHVWRDWTIKLNARSPRLQSPSPLPASTRIDVNSNSARSTGSHNSSLWIWQKNANKLVGNISYYFYGPGEPKIQSQRDESLKIALVCWDKILQDNLKQPAVKCCEAARNNFDATLCLQHLTRISEIGVLWLFLREIIKHHNSAKLPWISNFPFVFLFFCLFVFLYLSLFVFLYFCLHINSIKCLKGLKSQKSLFVSKF